MGVNKTIIVAVIIIMASGLYTVLVATKPAGTRSSNVTRVVVGAYLLGIAVSIVDLLGGPFRQVSNGLLLVAVLTALYAILPDIGQRVQQRKQA